MNGELTGTETFFLRKLRSSYGILTDERNSYVLLQRKRLNGMETWTWKPGVTVTCDGAMWFWWTHARSSGQDRLITKRPTIGLIPPLLYSRRRIDIGEEDVPSLDSIGTDPIEHGACAPTFTNGWAW